MLHLCTCRCLLRRPRQEDRGHRKRRVRLNKATWVNLTATRYRGPPVPVVTSLSRSGTTTSVHHLLGHRADYCRLRRRCRLMDAQKVELLGHHRYLRAQLPFRSAGGSPASNRRSAGQCLNNGSSGGSHHSADSASLLAACFGTCRPTFARKVS